MGIPQCHQGGCGSKAPHCRGCQEKGVAALTAICLDPLQPVTDLRNRTSGHLCWLQASSWTIWFVLQFSGAQRSTETCQMSHSCLTSGQSQEPRPLTLVGLFLPYQAVSANLGVNSGNGITAGWLDCVPVTEWNCSKESHSGADGGGNSNCWIAEVTCGSRGCPRHTARSCGHGEGKESCHLAAQGPARAGAAPGTERV